MTVGLSPGRGYRIARRIVQSAVVLAIVASPLAGGYQRSDRANVAVVGDDGWNLPPALRAMLPGGEMPARAHDANRLLGGGIASDYLGLPAMDPLAGLLAMLSEPWTQRSALSLALPVLLALAAGRLFCGWLCPFGILSRALESLALRVRGLPRYRVPAFRPLRFVVLGAGVLGAAVGVHALLYLSLPYLLVQHSVYALWLLGGGSAVLSVLLGLLLAGLVFGPTIYCAALCPTGATLSALGHARVVRLKVVDQPSCGTVCGMCNAACWLQLNPRSGDPGPDCDLCARCVPACPRSNLRIELSRPQPGARTALAAAVLLAVMSWPATAAAQTQIQPELVFERELRIDGATLAVSVFGVHAQGSASADDAARSELSVFITRGEIGEPDEYGVLPQRDYHSGSLRVDVHPADGGEVTQLRFERANHPISTQRPSIYRRLLPRRFAAGDRVVVHAVDGYLPQSVELVVAPPGTRVALSEHLLYLAAAALLFGGLMSLALAVPTRADQA